MPTPSAATGSTTDHGKPITSRNAVKHNCTSKVLIVAEERQADFDALLEGLIVEYQPETEMQNQRVSEMARATWELRRVQREWDKSQARLYAEQPNMCEWNSKQQAEADRMSRYRTRAERTYNRALQSVECLRTMRLRAEQRAFWANIQLSKLDQRERRLQLTIERCNQNLNQQKSPKAEKRTDPGPTDLIQPEAKAHPSPRAPRLHSTPHASQSPRRHRLRNYYRTFETQRGSIIT